nr:reverse transcriptase domain-containing protein [Tanacetum cinerariifolium]
MIQNKVPPKLRDPGGFFIPCNFNKAFLCNALANLGASINLMPYSLYAGLSPETLKPTKMRVRLAGVSFQYPVRIAENMLVEFVIRVKQKQLNLGIGTKRRIFNIDSALKHYHLKDDTCFSIDVIDEILEEDFDVLLDEAMTADENSDSESDTKEPPFEKITINTDYKIKTSLEEPPTDLEHKPLPNNMEYVFLEEPSFLPLLDDKKPVVQKQRSLNPNMQEVVKKEIVKLLDTGIIYPIADSPWVSPIHCVLKKGGITVVTNENDKLVPTRTSQVGECMLAIFHDMIEESVEVFMDDFFVFGNSFETCLNNIDKMLQRCKDAHLVLNWEKCHFIVKEGIVLGHKVSSAGLEVDKAKIDVISKLSPLANIKGSRKLAFVFIVVDTCKETRVRRKDIIRGLLIVFILPYLSVALTEY